MYVRKNETLYTLWTPDISGTSPRPTGALPRFVVFNDTIPIYSGAVTHGFGISGVFGVSIPTTGALFVTGAFYNVSAEATLSGFYKTDIISRFYIGSYRTNGYTGYNESVYYTDFNFCSNNLSGYDKYTAIWFKNDNMVQPSITFMTIRDYTGGAPINSQIMNSIDGIFSYNITGSLRLNTGERYVCELQTNYDNGTRRARIPFSRDYNL